MPLYYNGHKIRQVYKGSSSIESIYKGSRLVWSKYVDFYTSTWDEIGEMIQDGSWKDNKWSVGLNHRLQFKDGTLGYVRIIGINDGRQDEEDFEYQVDKQSDGTPVHLTLELTSLLPSDDYLFESTDATAQTWSESLLYSKMQDGGEIYNNLPDDFKSLILPCVKKSGRGGQAIDSEPVESTNLLFIPALEEYTGKSGYSYNVNSKEGLQYEFYGRGGAIPKRPIGSVEQTMYYTRSAAAFENQLINYFWAIGSMDSFSVYPSYTPLGITFACCI